jgi:hypothetical protein
MAEPPDDTTVSEKPRASRTRLIVARSLVVLGAIVALLAAVAGYVRWQALDTETFKDTAGRLIANDDVRNQVATTLVDQLYTDVDVQAALKEQLPENLQPLAGPIAGASRELADRAAQRLLERPRAQELWVNSLAFTHQQLLRLLDDDLTSVRTEGGFLVLDLRTLVIQLGDQVAVIGQLGNRLPEDAGKVRIMKADQLETAQDLTQLFKTVATFLWTIPILLFAAAVWLARGRRRLELRAIAIAAIAVGFLVLVLRSLVGSYMVNNLVETESVRPAAEQAWGILTDLLTDGAWTFIGLGLIFLLGVWLAGPTASGTAARRWVAPVLVRPGLAYGILAALMLLVLWWGPTAQTRRPLQVLVAAVLIALGFEALRRMTVAEFPEAQAVSPRTLVTAPYERLRARRPAAADREADAQLEQLERLARLREAGVLTEEEVATRKAAVLGGTT